MDDAVMGVEVRAFASPAELGRMLASEVLDGAARARQEDRSYILSAPGGRSLRPTYSALAGLARERAADLSHLLVVMVDEYLELPVSQLTCVSADVGYSCRGFGQRVILGSLRDAIGLVRAPADNALWLPDPREPEAFDRRIEDAGGIDLFLMASGSFDGHVAFNGPGTVLESRSRVVELPEALRNDPGRKFMRSESLEDHPTHGVTIGLKTIAESARSAVLVCNGAEKRATVARIESEGRFTSDWPATLIFECRQARLWTDAEAAA
jgi:glucosamine-6-phosphate deaminase